MEKLAIDPAVLERMVSFGGNQLKLQLIDMFLTGIPERLNIISTGIHEEQAEPVERAAHSLISSAGNLGGFALSQLAAELGTAAMKPDFDKMRLIKSQIDEALQEFQIFLNQQKVSS